MNIELVHKYLANECSDEECRIVEDWINDQKENKEQFLSIKRIWNVDLQESLNDSLNSSLDINVRSEWNWFEKKITPKDATFRKKTKTEYDDFEEKKRIFKMPVYYVAALILIVGITGWYYYSTVEKTPAKQALHEIVSEKDQLTRFQLSDGTRVTLNANSRVKVPEQFAGKERKMFLEGEAFFEVTPDSLHPFVVELNGAEVKVLGTKFNVKAPAALQRVQVAVVKGRVLLQNEGQANSNSITLTKNSVGVYNLKTKDFAVEKTTVSNYLSWMTHRLVFKNSSLADVSRQLERIYNIDIHFGTNNLKSRRLSLNFEKKDMRSVLDIISTTLNISYTLKLNHVTWHKTQHILNSPGGSSNNQP